MTEQPGGRVLVIDDDDLVSRMLATHVKAAGFEVRTTDNTDEFIETARTWHPTHVCVDLVMGETDGLQVLTALAGVGSDATVIISSGMGPRVLDAAGAFAAASGLAFGGLLPKPFTRADVARVLAGIPQRGDARGTHHDPLDGWSAEQFEDDLRTALAGDQITLAYQPKVSCAEGTLVGFEALVRWHHPTVGEIEPQAFIPRAESVGLISEVTDAVMERALSWFGSRRNPGDERLAVNVSGSEMSDRGRSIALRRACAAANVDPERVILEVTETAAVEDMTASLELLTRLRLERFHLAIDDFGTGYSSMTQLSSLPFDELKIDRTFVRDCATSRPASVLVSSSLDLARGLGLSTTAEGVEDRATLNLLTSLGCDCVQGFYIARPMPHLELADWISAR